MNDNVIGCCLSTGRSGTFYLYTTLRATYGDIACIRHEDIENDQSKPNRYLWLFEDAALDRVKGDADVASYLDLVEQAAADRPYIDVGHGNVPLLPLLIREFGDRVRLLHLVRDPVRVAASNVTMGQYCENAASTVGENTGLPHPSQPQCAHPEFAEQWDTMSPFEKNLWRWAEYAEFGEEIHRRYPSVPYLVVPTHTLFGNAQRAEEIAQFYGLPSRKVRPPRRVINETNPNLTTMHSVGPEWRRYVDYPHVLNLAKQLGATVKQEDLESSMQKYAAPSTSTLSRYRWRQRFTLKWLNTKVRRLARALGLGGP